MAECALFCRGFLGEVVLALEDLSYLQVEQRIEVALQGKEKCLTKVADISNKGILVLPLVRQGRSITAYEGDNMLVTYWTNTSLFKFKSKVLQLLDDPIDSVLIEYPKDVVKIQRRQYFRMDVTNLPVQFSNINDRSNVYSGSAVDISGGGMAFVAKNEEINKDDIIYIKMTLSDFPIELVGKVVRKFIKDKEKPDLYEFPIEFQSLRERDRDRIIKFIFEKQAEERIIIKKKQ